MPLTSVAITSQQFSLLKKPIPINSVSTRRKEDTMFGAPDWEDYFEEGNQWLVRLFGSFFLP